MHINRTSHSPKEDHDRRLDHQESIRYPLTDKVMDFFFHHNPMSCIFPDVNLELLPMIVVVTYAHEYLHNYQSIWHSSQTRIKRNGKAIQQYRCYHNPFHLDSPQAYFHHKTIHPYSQHLLI